MNPIECKKLIQNLNGKDSAELNQYFYNDSFTYFDKRTFQVQIEKKQRPFTVNKLNTLDIGVFIYQPNLYDWIASTANSKKRCKDDQEYGFDKDRSSPKIEKNLWIMTII